LGGEIDFGRQEMTLAVPSPLRRLSPYFGTLEHWNKTAFLLCKSYTCGVPTKEIVWNKWHKILEQTASSIILGHYKSTLTLKHDFVAQV
jgi:hypothetical protein